MIQSRTYVGTYAEMNGGTYVANVHTKWLDKSIQLLRKKAREKGIDLGSNLVPAIKREAKEVGFLKGTHILVLTKSGWFKIKRSEHAIVHTPKKKKQTSVHTPEVHTSNLRKLASFKLPPSLLKKLAKRAERSGETKTAIVQKALEEYLGE